MNDKASMTAAVVASTLLLLREDPDLGPYVDRGAEPHIESAVRATIPLLGKLLDHVPWPLLKRAAMLVERAISPGFVAHYALRKHMIRTHLHRAIEDGLRQVVLLGAGFDMLSSSIPTHASVFEVDHPATQRAKRAAFADFARPIEFVPVDLSVESVLDALARTRGFDANADTVWVAEGLLMYLEPKRVEAVLRDIVRGPGRATAILTLVTPDPTGRVRLHGQRRIVDWCMGWLDEPFVWGEREENVRPLLARHGLEVTSLATTTEVRDRVLGGRQRRRMPRSMGELVIVASRGLA